MRPIALLTEPGVSELRADDEVLASACRRRGLPVTLVPWSEARTFQDSHAAHVIRTTWDYHHQPDRFLKELQVLPNLVNPYPTVAWNCDKTYLQDLSDAGVRIVPTEFHEALTTDRLYTLERERRPHPWVIKPTVSAGASLTFAVHGEDDLDAVDQALTHHPEKRWMVQPLMECVRTAGEVSLIFFASGFSHAVRKLPAPGDFRVQEEFGGRLLSDAPSPSEIGWGESLLSTVKHPWVYARVDFVRDPEPCLMELELIEPSLFLSEDLSAADRFVDELLRFL